MMNREERSQSDNGIVCLRIMILYDRCPMYSSLIKHTDVHKASEYTWKKHDRQRIYFFESTLFITLFPL
jgi:hypothetical protein